MGTLANSVNPDEMQPNAAYHQGLHCCHDLNNLQGQEYIRIKKILPVTALSTQWAVLYLLFQYLWENQIRIQRVECYITKQSQL